jgi:hypothetical protein
MTERGTQGGTTQHIHIHSHIQSLTYNEISLMHCNELVRQRRVHNHDAVCMSQMHLAAR